MTGLLFDLGGTYLRAGVAGPDCGIRHVMKKRIANVADGTPPELIWQGIAAGILDYESRHSAHLSSDAPIVLSFPGPIANGVEIVQAPTVAGGNHTFDLPRLIARATGRSVSVLNDVSAAAWHLAEITPVRRFLVVTVSSGIGAKLFDRCHASGVLDSPAYAGEIGHVVVDDSANAPVCDCGGRGHLGAIASGRGIERIARERSGRRELTNEHDIVPAFRANDCWTSALIRECTRPLVRSLLTVAMAAGLERVFLMGGFANALGTPYITLIRELACELSRYDVARPSLDTLFEGMPLDHETSLHGCAAYLRSNRMRL
jgi:glucokinase